MRITIVFRAFRKKIIFLLFLPCLTILGCGTNAGNEITTWHEEAPNQVYETYTINLSDSLRHGPYKSYYLSGACFEESTYRKGKLDGKRVLYYQNGTPMVIETHVKGKFEGRYQTFYENGVLDVDGHYLEGKMENQWRRHYADGSLMEIVTFRDNLENGPFTEFYPNGNLKAKGNYLNGDAEHGLLELFDSTGNLMRKMDCVEGVCRTIWKSEDVE